MKVSGWSWESISSAQSRDHGIVSSSVVMQQGPFLLTSIYKTQAGLWGKLCLKIKYCFQVGVIISSLIENKLKMNTANWCPNTKPAYRHAVLVPVLIFVNKPQSQLGFFSPLLCCFEIDVNLVFGAKLAVSWYQITSSSTSWIEYIMKGFPFLSHGTMYNEMGPPHTNHQLRKLAHRPVWWKIFSIEVPSCQQL